MNAKTLLTEWQFLHKQHRQQREQSNWPAVKRIEKRIAELKPQYVEFSKLAASDSKQTTTHQRVASTRLQHASNTASTNAEHDEAAGNHLAFNFYAVSGSQRASILCDRVFNLWKKSRSLKRTPSTTKMQEYHRIIETIVANLLYSQATKHDGVRFTRDRAVYASPSRYRPTVFNERFLSVIDELDALGIVRQVKGDRWKKSIAQKFFPELSQRQPDLPTTKPYGLKQSYITTGKTLEQMKASLSFDPSIHDANFIHEGREVIILKKGEGSQLLDYRDEEFPEAQKCRKQIQIINDMLLSAGDLLTPEGQSQYDQRQRYLVRRFTHSSTESGGRLWEGFWINGMKRAARPAILRLNGEETVELDFSSMIVRLAYIIAEKPCPDGDQYNIPGLDPESRDGIKRVMGTLLFDSSRNRDRFPKDVAQLFTPKDQRKGWSQVDKAIRTHHYELRAYLDRGLGHYLQFLESQVLINVLLRCAQRGLVALPLHDCIIVPRSQVVRATGIMGQTVRYMFGREADIPVIAKGLEEEEKRVA